MGYTSYYSQKKIITLSSDGHCKRFWKVAGKLLEKRGANRSLSGPN
jgi:hypothetical protein